MRVTKLGHACLLVETPERVGLFDPGFMSDVPVSSMSRLDDIIITHEHGDHLNIDCIRALHVKFPDVRIWSSPKVSELLNAAKIDHMEHKSTPEVEIFEAPHAPVEPLFPMADNIGVHYLGKLTHPGDSFDFKESREILALPVAAPWGSTTDALALAIKLKPKFVLPIHDWHWSDQARVSMYERLEAVLNEEGITFFKLVNGTPVQIDV